MLLAEQSIAVVLGPNASDMCAIILLQLAVQIRSLRPFLLQPSVEGLGMDALKQVLCCPVI